MPSTRVVDVADRAGLAAVAGHRERLAGQRLLVAYAFPLGLALLLIFRYAARKWLHAQSRLHGRGHE
jgi:hypothetical protein